MQLFFADESGTAPPPDKTNTKYFVVGGVIIAEDQWHHIAHDLNHIKTSFSISGEIKWRFFGQKLGQEQKENNLKHLNFEQRDALRTAIFSIINKYQSMRLICTVTNVIEAYQRPYIKSSDDIYWYTYKPLTERFQYYLQDLSKLVGSKINGIIVCDHRARKDDEYLRKMHARLLDTEDEYKNSSYKNLIEGLFIAPSHLSVGIQLADMVVGAVFRKFEHDDDKWFKLLEPSWRKSTEGKKEGYGLVMFPK